MLRITRTIAEVAVCAAVGSAFAYGCYVATTPTIPNSASLESSPAGVIHEDDPRWDCETMGNRVCGPRADGSIHAPGSFTAQSLLVPCAGEDREPHLPCRVLMRPTYVIGGDGVRHEVCAITLVNREDSTMVCADDTVWLS